MRADPQVSCYRRRRSGAEDPNARRLDIGPITVWFSYTTPVAFHVAGHPRVVRRNDWSNTTGRHLNEIDGGDRASRVDGETFVKLLEERCGRFFYPRDLDADAPREVVADWLRDRGLDKAADAVMKDD